MWGFAFLVLASCLAADASGGDKGGTRCRHPGGSSSVRSLVSAGMPMKQAPSSHIWIANPISRHDRPVPESTGPLARSLRATRNGLKPLQRRRQAGPQASGFVVPLTFVAHARSLEHAPSSQQDRPAQHQEQRHLAEASTALHGSLVGLGYYYADVWIGTPSQRFSLLVDTGSALTFVPLRTCGTHCGQHTNAPYNPAASATHQDVPCSSDVCPTRRCDALQRCGYSRDFAENSSAAGVLAVDVLGFSPELPSTSRATESADDTPRDSSSVTATASGTARSGAGEGSGGVGRVVFGCTERETGQLFSQRADGVLGLGRGARSLVQQLGITLGLRRQFSLCYAGVEQGRERGGGLLVLGESPEATAPPMSFTPLNPKASSYFQVTVESMKVQGRALPMKSSVYNSGLGAVVDSGTTFTYLPQAAYVHFRDSVVAHAEGLEVMSAADREDQGLCFRERRKSNWTRLAQSFPSVEIAFGAGVVYHLHPENYMFEHLSDPDVRCLGVFPTPDSRFGMVLGALLWKNTLITFDMEAERLGFVKTECASATSSHYAADQTRTRSRSRSRFFPGGEEPVPGGASNAGGGRPSGTSGEGADEGANGSSHENPKEAGGSGRSFGAGAFSITGVAGETLTGLEGSAQGASGEGVQTPGSGAPAGGLLGAPSLPGSGEPQDGIAAGILALAGEEVGGADAVDAETALELGRVKSFRTVDATGCNGCSSYIDITLLFYNPPPANPPLSSATPPSPSGLSTPAFWAFLPGLVQSSLTLLPGQVLFISAAPNDSLAVGVAGAQPLDVTVRVVPYGYQKFISGITAERVQSGILNFTLPAGILNTTGPFNVSEVNAVPAVFTPPPSPAPVAVTGAWRPWVFMSLAVLTVALVAVWLFKIWRERRAVRQATSYVSMTAMSGQDKRTTGQEKRDEEPSRPGPALAPVVTMSTSSSPSITTVCHSPKRLLSVPQV